METTHTSTVDTAVIIEDEEVYKEGAIEGMDAKPLSYISSKFALLIGLRVTEIRLIFMLPMQFGKFSQPLAYIHWFKQFHSWDRQLGMYKLS